MNDLIINGIDHSVFDLEWAKRGGVVFCVNKFSKDLMLGNVVVGVHDIAWFISVSYQSPNSDWRRCSASSGERLNQFANIRMATPAECAEAGVDYIEPPARWLPIERATMHTDVLRLYYDGSVSVGWINIAGEDSAGNDVRAWQPKPQPPKDE